MKRRLALGLVSLFIGLPISQAGCLGCFGPIYVGTVDAGFAITGRVYEWIDAPDNAVSEIHAQGLDSAKDSAKLLEEIYEEVSDDLSLLALEDAEITLDIKDRTEDFF